MHMVLPLEKSHSSNFYYLFFTLFLKFIVFSFLPFNQKRQPTTLIVLCNDLNMKSYDDLAVIKKNTHNDF